MMKSKWTREDDHIFTNQWKVIREAQRPGPWAVAVRVRQWRTTVQSGGNPWDEWRLVFGRPTYDTIVSAELQNRLVLTGEAGQPLRKKELLEALKPIVLAHRDKFRKQKFWASLRKENQYAWPANLEEMYS